MRTERSNTEGMLKKEEEMAANDRESESEKRKEKAFERMLADALSAHARKDCPDAEILAAFYERSLDAAETARWRAHFAGCSRCQQALVALAASDPNPLAEEEIARLGELVAAAGAPARVAPRPRISRWAWFLDPRSLAPLAAAAVFGVAIWVAVRSPNVAPVENFAIAPTTSEALTAENKAAPAAPSALAQLSPSPSEPPAMQVPEHSATREMPAAAPAPPPPPPVAMAGNAGSAAAESSDRTAESAEQAAAAAPAPASPPEQQESRAATANPGAAGGGIAPGAAGGTGSGSSGGAIGGAEEGLSGRAETLTVTRTVRAKSQIAGFVAANSDSQIVWSFGGGGRIARSSDGGRTWAQQMSPVQTELLAGSAPSETVCWLVGRGGAIVRTTDGVKWEVVASPAEAEQDGQAPDWTFVEARDALYVVIRTENGRRFFTSDGGKTWQTQ
jgi:hypothetical protein